MGLLINNYLWSEYMSMTLDALRAGYKYYSCAINFTLSFQPVRIINHPAEPLREKIYDKNVIEQTLKNKNYECPFTRIKLCAASNDTKNQRELESAEIEVVIFCLAAESYIAQHKGKLFEEDDTDMVEDITNHLKKLRDSNEKCEVLSKAEYCLYSIMINAANDLDPKLLVRLGMYGIAAQIIIYDDLRGKNLQEIKKLHDATLDNRSVVTFKENDILDDIGFNEATVSKINEVRLMIRLNATKSHLKLQGDVTHSLTNLFEEFSRNESVRILEISNHRLNEEEIKVLFDILPLSKIETLILSAALLYKAEYIIFDYLNNTGDSPLHTLDLSNNKINFENQQYYVHISDKSRWKKLKRLDLRGNTVPMSFVVHMNQQLTSKILPSKEILSLYGLVQKKSDAENSVLNYQPVIINNSDQKKERDFKEANDIPDVNSYFCKGKGEANETQSISNKLERDLKNNLVCKTLKLCGFLDYVKIFKALRDNTSVKSLEIYNTVLTDEQWEEFRLALGMYNRNSLEVLKLIKIDLSSKSANNGIYFINSRLTSLISLQLENCKILPSFYYEIFSDFKNNEKLQVLNLNGNYIDLNLNNLGDKDVSLDRIFDGLTGFSNKSALHTLILSHNNIRCTDQIFENLKKYFVMDSLLSRLKILDLTGNKIASQFVEKMNAQLMELKSKREQLACLPLKSSMKE